MSLSGANAGIQCHLTRRRKLQRAESIVIYKNEEYWEKKRQSLLGGGAGALEKAFPVMDHEAERIGMTLRDWEAHRYGHMWTPQGYAQSYT
ncbi:MAG: hypothetical protein ACREYF_15705 [Gammaproteobacteria bacterium]